MLLTLAQELPLKLLLAFLWPWKVRLIFLDGGIDVVVQKNWQ
jgi:hypothetical protein